MKDTLTVQEGIAIQANDLAKWSHRLNSETFQKLFQIVTKDNRKAETGYDIIRGDRITHILITLP